MASRHIKSVALPALMVMALIILAACGVRGPAYHSSTGAQYAENIVNMTNLLNYKPAAITINRGETIEWRNKSLVTHTVTAMPGQAQNPANVVLPEGAKPFDSGPVEAGQVYRHTFNVAGTYRYFCRPHEKQGMVGTIVVK